MAKITVEELIELLKEHADPDGDIIVNWEDPNISQMKLEDIGFDSLSIFNVIHAIEVKHGISVGYENISDRTSPAVLVDVVNAHLSKQRS